MKNTINILENIIQNGEVVSPVSIFNGASGRTSPDETAALLHAIPILMKSPDKEMLKEFKNAMIERRQVDET